MFFILETRWSIKPFPEFIFFLCLFQSIWFGVRGTIGFSKTNIPLSIILLSTFDWQAPISSKIGRSRIAGLPQSKSFKRTDNVVYFKLTIMGFFFWYPFSLLFRDLQPTLGEFLDSTLLELVLFLSVRFFWKLLSTETPSRPGFLDNWWSWTCSCCELYG